MDKLEKNKLKIRQRRTFSEEFKRQKVQQIVDKLISVAEVAEHYKVSRVTVYRWLYRYSPHHEQGTIQVVQMQSEEHKTKQLRQQIAELERIIGQKQLHIDYLEKLIVISSEELKIDLNKNFDMTRSNGSAETEPKIPGQ